VYANAVQFLDSAVFTLYAGVKPERVMDTIRVFHSELGKVAREGIPPEELKRIKDSLIYSFELSLESSESRMMSVSTSELFFKRGMTFKGYCESVRKIRAEDTKLLAAEWVKTCDPTILVLAKKPRSRQLLGKIRNEAQRLTGTPVNFTRP
jgi:predicted Zn-dependent peptidase